MYSHKTIEGYFSHLLLRCENRNEIPILTHFSNKAHPLKKINLKPF